MKLELSHERLPAGAVFVTCVTEEDRCRGVIDRMGGWRPQYTLLGTYAGSNARRDDHLTHCREELVSRHLAFEVIECSEKDPANCLRQQITSLTRFVLDQQAPIVIDISVFTKRHLLMLLRWCDDMSAWGRLTIVYSEPEDYVVSEFIPLTFGLESLQQIPGSPGVADCSRPVHLVLFLGYEGDRALAVYEQVQPMHTTIVIPSPPFRPEWEGRTQIFNRDLLSLTGDEPCQQSDALDPEDTTNLLQQLFVDNVRRGPNAVVISPLGTKPQTLGLFAYLREAHDPPAVIYASPLRHNQSFFSHGIGKSWILKARQ
ncbi:hypothetical protein SH661x_004340 [Planctomicrobium sp. SH661]|uniref:hypothetical protein n=1 Tax=Planctomicrobium sp. SH661 TaxID=3448124 RepID=UPI003F5C13C6